jgi:hypothetical protein
MEGGRWAMYNMERRYPNGSYDGLDRNPWAGESKDGGISYPTFTFRDVGQAFTEQVHHSEL